MKKKLSLFMMLLSIAASTFAEEVEIGGLWYELKTTQKEAKVIQYKNNTTYSGDIVIPETVEYKGAIYRVTSLGIRAFFRCSSLTSITIPNSIKSLENYVFQKCSSLTTATLPNSVTNMGSFTFSGCSNLTSVTISNSVTNIEYYVFQECI
jgi:hypothetical protein